MFHSHEVREDEGEGRSRGKGDFILLGFAAGRERGGLWKHWVRWSPSGAFFLECLARHVANGRCALSSRQCFAKPDLTPELKKLQMLKRPVLLGKHTGLTSSPGPNSCGPIPPPTPSTIQKETGMLIIPESYCCRF